MLAQRPGFSVAANNLAMILLRGEPEQAMLDQAMELVEGFELSENPIYLDTLGWAYLKRGDLNKAVSVLQRASRAKANIPEIDYHLGLAYYRLGRKVDAKHHLTLAMAEDTIFEGKKQAQALLDELE